MGIDVIDMGIFHHRHSATNRAPWAKSDSWVDLISAWDSTLGFQSLRSSSTPVLWSLPKSALSPGFRYSSLSLACCPSRSCRPMRNCARDCFASTCATCRSGFCGSRKVRFSRDSLGLSHLARCDRVRMKSLPGCMEGSFGQCGACERPG